jgi:LPPG:FO 2-phospho-L-lactate transferase
MSAAPRVLALCGGIGGAKLALGLARTLPRGQLAIAVNTGDDFEHLGLTICPDLDTVLYTLAGLADPERGWGRAGESWSFMRALEAQGGPGWFALGDQDLAVHVQRSEWLRTGEPLAAVIARLASPYDLGVSLWPMSNQPVRTVLHTDEGVLPFQDYFVRRRCEPVVRAIEFDGAERATVLPDIAAALASPTLEAVIICPSNPHLSIAPLLAMPSLRAGLASTRAPIVAVSPLIGGQAVKGPTSKLMRELGAEPGVAAVAAFYGDWLDGLVVDDCDREHATRLNLATRVTRTRMVTLADRERLAGESLAFARSLRGRLTRRAS